MRQKFAFSVAISFTCLTILLEPASGGSPELEKLNASYQRKIDEVVKPYRDRLLSDLLTKERSLAKAGKLEEALEIREQRVACSLVTEPDDLLKSLPAGDAKIDSAVQVYVRHYRAGVRPWEKKYIEELRKLERHLATLERLDDAIEVKKLRLKIEKESIDQPPIVVETLRLTDVLPDRTYTYELEEGTKRKIIFLAKGKAYFDTHPSNVIKWQVRAQNTVIIDSPGWSSPSELLFSKDFTTFSGVTTATKRWRKGRLITNGGG